MGRIVIACYRPKPGHEADLARLVDGHVDMLRSLGLVTDRAPVAMQADDGTIVEVFEWASAKAIEQAHADPAVQQLWTEFAAVCDYVPIAGVAEAKNLFSEFTPL